MLTQRTRVRRNPKRGRHDRETVDAILDEALVAHVAFVHDGRPAVIPTLLARVGDEVYLHGSSAGRAVRALAAGAGGGPPGALAGGIALAPPPVPPPLNH